MEMQVREPDPHHFHWGLVLNFNEGEDCYDWCDAAMLASRERGFEPFMQGGHHLWGERCSRRHYIEFWGLDGAGDFRQDVVQLMLSLEATRRV